MHRLMFLIAIPFFTAATGGASPPIAAVTAHVGEMSATIATRPDGARETLRFEPLQMLDDLFRKDIVLLMRHGPTDWSVRDEVDVAPSDCGGQRNLSDDGRQNMVDLGVLLAGNGIRPDTIVASQWCRSRDTQNALVEGFGLIDPEYSLSVALAEDTGVNLLLSLQGAATVTPLRDLIAGWTGEGKTGPLLIVSHFTNIEELTEFHVYEGEILVLDPKRDGRVLGYLRLRSAEPDIGHFSRH